MLDINFLKCDELGCEAMAELYKRQYDEDGDETDLEEMEYVCGQIEKIIEKVEQWEKEYEDSEDKYYVIIHTDDKDFYANQSLYYTRPTYYLSNGKLIDRRVYNLHDTFKDVHNEIYEDKCVTQLSDNYMKKLEEVFVDNLNNDSKYPEEWACSACEEWIKSNQDVEAINK